MNVGTTRVPFTKPLTGQEMRYIQQRISEVMRAKRRDSGPNSIDAAIYGGKRPPHWPPLVEVPDHLQWFAATA